MSSFRNYLHSFFGLVRTGKCFQKAWKTLACGSYNTHSLNYHVHNFNVLRREIYMNLYLYHEINCSRASPPIMTKFHANTYSLRDTQTQCDSKLFTVYLIVILIWFCMFYCYFRTHIMPLLDLLCHERVQPYHPCLKLRCIRLYCVMSMHMLLKVLCETSLIKI